jgi:hypothetical protein
MKRVLLFLALLFGLVSIGLAMYSRGAKPDGSSQSGSYLEERQALSQPRTKGTFTF